MPSPADAARRVAVAARLLLKDLLRRRLTLILLFVVPALFDAVVLATTAARRMEVTLGTLVDPSATVHLPGTPRALLDPGLLDDGSRVLDQRGLSLVFLGGAAVCFLSCFLAFYLVHKRTEIDARLVLAGYRPWEVLAAKVLVLVVLVAAIAAYETAIVRPWVALLHPPRVAAGFFFGGLLYGCFGLLLGAVAVHELEGIFLIVLLTNIDVGWLQNPIYYATSERRGIIEALPGYFPTQLAVLSAFTHEAPAGAVWKPLAYAGAVLSAALVAFGLRIRPAPAEVSRASFLRWHYLKVLLVVYAAWFVTFQIVGRYAATLPTVDLTTALDRAIPLVPGFVWPYEACYLFPFVSIAIMRDHHRFNVAVLAIAIASAAAYAVYLLLPVSFPRPELGAGLAEKVLAMEYAADFHPGANKLPSTHVAFVWIMAAAMRGEARRGAVDGLIAALVVAITLSTLFVKQHIVVDAVGGVIWGLGAFWLAGRLYSRVADAGALPEDALRQLLEPRRWWALVRGTRSS
jgi:membrane-associated phospholipid phosphatase